MPSIKMTELSTELKRLGLENRLEMTGGNCGTITIGQPDADGFYWGIGPGNYYLDYITPEDMCWGKDTGARTDELFYYTGTSEDFTVANVARLIVKSYQTTTCEDCGGYNNDTHLCPALAYSCGFCGLIYRSKSLGVLVDNNGYIEFTCNMCKKLGA